jgi:hypothetical protein
MKQESEKFATPLPQEAPTGTTGSSSNISNGLRTIERLMRASTQCSDSGDTNWDKSPWRDDWQDSHRK